LWLTLPSQTYTLSLHDALPIFRQGRVLEINGDKALVQLFESAQGLQISTAKARFLGRGIELSVSIDMLGRVFDGLGRPRDGGPEDRKSTRLNSSHVKISYAVFC